MLYKLYERATGWLCVPHLERRIALLALLCALPSLAIGLEADDYVLREQLMKDGPFAAYLFTPAGAQASHEQLLEQRVSGHAPWWAAEHPQMRFFRPLSSLSLWLDFANGLPPWWMHLENCAIYAMIVWLAATRVRFTFDRPLDAPGLTFRYWDSSDVATWTPPPVGGRVQLSAATAL